MVDLIGQVAQKRGCDVIELAQDDEFAIVYMVALVKVYWI